MDELTIGDKIYISSKRAAEITGYAKDYIGQLCREGRVEATLVGRSWYVLETSIRDHRFGSEGSSGVRNKESVAAAGSKEGIGSWESPKYESEEVVEVPQVERRPINLLEGEPVSAPEPIQKAETTVEDMQSAWREWFATRNREKLIESPEVIDARAEEEGLEAQGSLEDSQSEAEEDLAPATEEEEEVRINRVVTVADRVYDPIPSTPEVEEPVRIHRQATIAYAAPEPSKRSPRVVAKRKGKNYLAVRALLLSLALIAVAVAVIGTGNADSLLGDDARTYEPVKYLGGTRTIE